MNIFSFGELTSSEEISYDFALRMGLLPQPLFFCPGCGGHMMIDKSKIRHGFYSVKRCNKRNCRLRCSMLKGSIIEGSKLKLSELLRLFYCYAMKLTVTETVLHTNLNLNTIVSWNKIIRNRISNNYNALRLNKIGGEALTVEIDEAHLYTNRRRIGRRMVGESYWIVAGICRETRDVFYGLTTIRDANYLSTHITDNVETNTRIITDGWRGYTRLNRLGYAHHIINHTYHFVHPFDNTIHTNTIERLWRDLRSNIPYCVRFDVLKNHIDDYMHNRIMNNKKSTERFNTLMKLFSFE